MTDLTYLGLCVRYDPPLIGVYYALPDQKKKIYMILLKKLVLHPDALEAAKQLYLEHPHILKEDKIPLTKIAALIEKIKAELQIQNDEEQYEKSQEEDEEKQNNLKKEGNIMNHKKYFNFKDNDFDDESPLNKSL